MTYPEQIPDLPNDDQLVRDIRAHLVNHPGDNAADVASLLRAAGRDVSLLDVKHAWLRAGLRMV